MELLEREQALQELRSACDQAAEGGGRIALVSGEAGIGKTSLVERFVAERSTGVLWGTCESLFTPRPLGPLYDIAHQSDGGLRALLEAGVSRASIFSNVLTLLRSGERTVVVIVEDVHWADEATLDLIKFLGRRIHQSRSLLVATYRDDEVGPDHPLRSVLGDLPHHYVTRIRLSPLSKKAVGALAANAGRTGDELYSVTGGNPFFVAEVLASEDGEVPVTVRDAVLARALRLTPAARAVLEAVSVVPSRAERWLLDDVVHPSPAALEECTTRGMLRYDGEALAFRHELSRLAVEETLSVLRRRELHARVLATLTNCGQEPIDLARSVHHADCAGDSAAVLRFAPEAARQAARLGAHRMAAAHYQTALRHAVDRPAEERAALLDERSHECYLTGRVEEARKAGEEAFAIWRELGARAREGDTLRRLSRIAWFLGDKEQGDACAREAVDRLESLPAGPALAMAYSNLSQQYMVALESSEAQRWGGKALQLAEQLGEIDVVIHALNNIGTTKLYAHDESGWALLERSLRLALEHDRQEHVARAYGNLTESAMWLRDHERAHHYFDDGITYCVDRDLYSNALCMIGERGLLGLRQGDWDAAAEDAARVLRSSSVPPVDRITPLVVLGLIRARRGDPDARSALDEARSIAFATGEVPRISLVAAARAEDAWLRGRLESVRDDVSNAFDLALRHSSAWPIGELGFWLWRSGSRPKIPGGAARPYALHMAGDWRAAADAWEHIGCPYERAVALADGDESDRIHALEIFERLGAGPAAAILRQDLRADGVRGVPRGPRPATRANPGGLTSRQMDVLDLLAKGLSNADIGAKLFVSPKTVEHHVTAILAKIGAESRTEAAALALNRGWVTSGPAS